MPEPLSRAAAAAVELQNALADVKLEPAAGESNTLADVARGHLDAIARIIHAGEVLEKLHAHPTATISLDDALGVDYSRPEPIVVVINTHPTLRWNDALVTRASEAVARIRSENERTS